MNRVLIMNVVSCVRYLSVAAQGELFSLSNGLKHFENRSFPYHLTDQSFKDLIEYAKTTACKTVQARYSNFVVSLSGQDVSFLMNELKMEF